MAVLVAWRAAAKTIYGCGVWGGCAPLARQPATWDTARIAELEHLVSLRDLFAMSAGFR